MYEQANVSGPSEFGRLPPADRAFWLAWLDEYCRREQKRQEELEDELN
jgi:G:T-mismatch repair DNA endonuclease (very short patch repair protein)